MCVCIRVNVDHLRPRARLDSSQLPVSVGRLAGGHGSMQWRLGDFAQATHRSVAYGRGVRDVDGPRIIYAVHRLSLSMLYTVKK